MRVYPAAIRVDSSNFNPLQSWKRGVQMAALNWQTYDIHLQMNEAMFAAGTDRTGYVLKPEEMRHAKHMPITEALQGQTTRREKKGKQLVRFSVEVVSAQRLPRPRNHNPAIGMNPYIEFEMFSAEDKARGLAKGEGGTDASARDGSSGIGSPLRRRTKIVEGNGFDPTFNENIAMMVETKYPSLIFVRWTVWNSPDGRNLSSNSTILATCTAKLSSLQQGYRHLPLVNSYGERYRDAKLFVKIKKEAPIPLHSDEPGYGHPELASSSPRLEPVRHDSRSWPRKIFGRAPSDRRRREQELRGSISRNSSMER
jgi:phosphatidylinositol phospholipase C delta